MYFFYIIISPYYIRFEITGDPCNLNSSHWYNILTNGTISCFELHLFPSQKRGFTKKTIDCLKKPINLQENEKQLLQLPTN